MPYRANPSGIHLSETDAATVKAMLARGDRQHDIAAWFGVNSGRIAEIASGQKFREVVPRDGSNLPPPGPYPSGKDAHAALSALRLAKTAILAAEAMVESHIQ